MDRVLYTAMTAAKHTKAHQTLISNNIANANTDGFKKDLLNITTLKGSPETRVQSNINNSIANTSQGSIKNTGALTDVTAQNGWLAGIDKNGIEHFLSSASLSVNSDGMLVDSRQNLILNAGMDTIDVGQVKSISIGRNGEVNIIPIGGNDTNSAVIDTIGIFDIDGGLSKDRFGNLTSLNESVASVSGFLNPGTIEGSNVVMAQEMLSMIENNRQYEFSMKLISTAKGMHDSATKLLR